MFAVSTELGKRTCLQKINFWENLHHTEYDHRISSACTELGKRTGDGHTHLRASYCILQSIADACLLQLLNYEKEHICQTFFTENGVRRFSVKTKVRETTVM